MEEVTCGLCGVRVSNWMMATGKTEVIGGKIYHRACLTDYQLKHGKPFVGAPPNCAECRKPIQDTALVSLRGLRYHLGCYVEKLNKEKG